MNKIQCHSVNYLYDIIYRMQELIDKSKYQVFICGSKAHLPFIFASHSWIILNKKGSISRWEIIFRKNKDKSLGYLHIDDLPPFKGISILPFMRKIFSKGKLLGYIEGDPGSVAEQAIDFVEKSKKTYPYLRLYVLTGPNSNTYTKWVLNNFPEFKIRLPWTFVGKDYNKGIRK